MMLGAGATHVVVMSRAHWASVAEMVKVAHGMGGEVMADVLAAEDKAEDARAMQDLGVDWIIVHTGFDERRYVRGVSPLDDLDAVVAAVDLPVQAVGGLSIEQALETVRRGARSVVIGAPLAIQADRFASGDEFEAILRDVVARVRALEAARPMRLADKVVLVTGSTSGIGEAIARRCVAEGARVLVHGLERDLGEAVAGSLGEAAALHVDDLADPEAAPRLVEAALRAFGRLDALVNNAARVERGTIETTDAAAFDRVIAVNVRAPLLLIRAALPELARAQRRGAQHRQHQRLVRRAHVRRLQREQGRAHDADPQPRRHPPPRARRAGQPDEPRLGAHREREAHPGEAGQRPGLVPEGPEGLRAGRPPHPPRGDRGRRGLLDRRREPAHQRELSWRWPSSR